MEVSDQLYAPGFHLIGGRVGPGTGLDAEVKEIPFIAPSGK